MSRPPLPMDPLMVARLHAAAAAEFAALGIERASLNRILEASGIAKSSFYHRYENKRALYDQLLGQVEGIIDLSLATLATSSRGADEFWRCAQESLAVMSDAAAAHPELGVFAAHIYRADAAADLARLRVKMTDRVTDYLAHGQDIGVVRGEVPAVLLASMAVASLLAIDAWALDHATDAQAPGIVKAALGAIRSTLGG